jgi:PAS domain-containing protein
MRAAPTTDGALAVFWRDVTERRQTQEALRESEARFRNMADQAPVMMWVTDADARCTYLNRAWYEFTGQSEEEGEGFGWLEAVHPDDRGWSGEVSSPPAASRSRSDSSIACGAPTEPTAGPSTRRLLAWD